MEGSSAQGQSTDRSRNPPYPRTASRSSTSSTRTRLSNTGSSSSHQLPAGALPHRYHHTRCNRSSTVDPPRSQLSREALENSRESLPTMSTYLQERLERERKVNDSERSSSRASNEAMSTPSDLRAIQSSPPRKTPTEGRRPRSSGGGEPSKKKGLGLKEMEQTLSTLHKQNFDLKLELFHRREKQTALEDRVEKLEADKAQTDDMNDQLILELEKRDKAVEEAVAMIVVLEARVEQLLREREMVRRVEEEGLFYAHGDSPGPEATPKIKMLETQFDNAKVLNRMPSFLSEQSENTANLRNVYLGVRGSVLSLQRTAEDAHEVDRAEHNGVSSPTLSVLSESSFLSVYGQKGPDEGSAHNNSPPAMDGPSVNRRPPVDESTQATNSMTHSQPRRVSISTGPNGLGQFQNIHDIMDMGGSPLQRLERLERTLTAMGEASRPPTSSQEQDIPPMSRPAQTLTQPKTKQEKREALQRVLTQGHQGPMGRELSHGHGLPPTPDTISTSTLRRFQSSNDTLSREQSLVNERSYLTLSETTASQNSGYEGNGSAKRLELPEQTNQAPSTTAFDSRRQLLAQSVNHLPVSMSPPPRPRSAGETTSDDDFGDGMDSMASSFDPWLRESLKPSQVDALDPMSSASQAGGKHAERASPDLFSFPATTGGWATSVMFGSLGGAGYMGAMGNQIPSPPMADRLDALGESLPGSYFGSGLASPVIGSSHAPPPPPNRRSSLQAATGSTSLIKGAGSIPGSPARPSPLSAKPKRSPVRASRHRSNSIDVRPPPLNLTEAGLRQDRAATVPPKQFHLPPPSQTQESQDRQQQQQQASQKQRHYPPTASQPARSRGLNSLFRRSTGSAEPPQLTAPSSAPPTETTFKNVPGPMMGLPSWGKRNSLLADDDRESATPPPILRNKGQPRADLDEGGGVPLNRQSSGGAPIGDIPGSPQSSGPNVNGGAPVGNVGNQPLPRNDGGGKRKWLGLGRVSSLRNRGI
ncbi:hypothetical protein B0H67DRAFT_498159 [Lasiosphaeris hirsuta]|uniref:Centrosomin N-terminal motif 1 domain-containing protein n=1 Tax=Lasiosphaeris hirsuta TaxID=260670 RepID=A0AA40DLB1_9PEZI|nr:hypothetical protein B0H67DRAFT_498159 [Lasiosphaeris hirsuta]